MANNEGKYEIIYTDEFIDVLLKESRVFNIALPKMVKRKVLEENEGLGKRVSLLDEELNKGNDNDGKEEEGSDDDEEDVDIFEDLKLPEGFFNGKKRKRSEDNNNCDENNEDKENNAENKSVLR